MAEVGRRAVPMPGRWAKWLTIGQDFLAHVDDLATLRVAAVCGRCGHPGHVGPSLRLGYVDVRCGCRAGSVAIDRELVVEALLLALGWYLRCLDCDAPIVGDNVPGSARLTLSCPCTTRTFVAPTVH